MHHLSKAFIINYNLNMSPRYVGLVEQRLCVDYVPN